MRNSTLLWLGFIAVLWLTLYHLLPNDTTKLNVFYRIVHNGFFAYSLLAVIIGYSIASTVKKVNSWLFPIATIVWIASLLPSLIISQTSNTLFIAQLALLLLSGLLFGAYIQTFEKKNKSNFKTEHSILIAVQAATLLCVLNTTYFFDKISSILVPVFALTVFALRSLEIQIRKNSNKKPH